MKLLEGGEVALHVEYVVGIALVVVAVRDAALALRMRDKLRQKEQRLEVEIETLKSSCMLLGWPGKIKRLTNELDQLRTRLGSSDSALAVYMRDETLAKMRKRQALITLCERNLFFGFTLFQPQLWLRGGVEGKIKRQKTKLKAELRMLLQAGVPPAGVLSHTIC